ncbi:tRNA uridine-5-carboxymethylaminomethyl(34) synthesis GTPase MnmE [Lysobacter sp. A6]|uniref:tRNA modification GTPase MnmE n=1 Tax=Noviluteimonas lactosilytica TaxID=2888523 RepID=A0ABS8JHI9_9GAMM|nr:tRNA uridine-5-carboxymethylaminomethyl(34) synthesis GTPase MnmE [Lysobacter lactosilyticus]
MTDHDADTIVAIATAPGAGGVGAVRLSGPRSRAIAEAICACELVPRHAHYVRMRANGETLDDGIALYFKAPASFTGEHVVELQAHGSPVVLQSIVAACRALGARDARPGEFSERAFLNGKLDLAQAEAVADLIAAADTRAARAARRALDGVFSDRVDAVATELLHLRIHVEAAIDFADESIDTLGGEQVREGLARASQQIAQLLADAERGRKLRDGLHAVIVGPPNAGKSSLLNALAGSDRAIVTDIAGTTRDLLHETVRLDGAELTLVDTAGLREGGDAIEREGMRRAREELRRADLAIVVLDARDPAAGKAAVADAIADVPRRLWIHNKADLLHAPASGNAARAAAAHLGDADRVEDAPLADTVLVSARTGDGLDTLHARLRSLSGAEAADASEGTFTARARHVDALARAGIHVEEASAQLGHEALELAAESLRAGHDALGEITGRVAPDALLGHIFGSFCIGK